MATDTFRNRLATGVSYVVSGLLFTCFSAGFSLGQETQDSKALELLKSMSSYLGEMKEFSVEGDVDFEVVTPEGQKLQVSSAAKVIVQRPSKLHLVRKGMVASTFFIYDGETLSLYGEKENSYGQLMGSGTIDDVFKVFEMETGVEQPGAGFLLSDPYEALSYDIKRSSYIGIGYVNGIECHHLAFRERKVDWQLWVQTGDTPLPMKFIITSKFLVSGPQYQLRFRNWNTEPEIDDQVFTFSPPEGAKKVSSLPTEELRRFTSIDAGVMARQSVGRKVTRTEYTVPIIPERCLPVVIQGVPLQNCEGAYYLQEDTHYVLMDVD